MDASIDSSQPGILAILPLGPVDNIQDRMLMFRADRDYLMALQCLGDSCWDPCPSFLIGEFQRRPSVDPKTTSGALIIGTPTRKGPLAFWKQPCRPFSVQW